MDLPLFTSKTPAKPLRNSLCSFRSESRAAHTKVGYYYVWSIRDLRLNVVNRAARKPSQTWPFQPPQSHFQNLFVPVCFIPRRRLCICHWGKWTPESSRNRWRTWLVCIQFVSSMSDGSVTRGRSRDGELPAAYCKSGIRSRAV